MEEVELFSISLLRSFAEFAILIAIGAIVAFLIGRLVNLIFDRTIEKAIDKTGLGKELRAIGLDFSDVMGIFVGAIIFLLFLQLGLFKLPTLGGLWQLLLLGVGYAINIVIALAFITAGLLFVVWFIEYVEKFVKRYREDISILVKMVLGVGLLWSVIAFALQILGLQYTVFQDLLLGFVIMSFGTIVIDLIFSKIEEAENLKPYMMYFLYSIFVLIAISAIFRVYITESILNIFAYGFVALFILALLPSVIKAVK
ncbi:MAG: hypothetical protein OH338_05760 [Candidatus Parvarchaeota archaeon]|nr:hypothetical protein [Candidatus Parvarchaeum tengchongense]